MELLSRIYRQKRALANMPKRRFLNSEIDWNQPLIGIKGQSGVGKTTLILQRIKEIDPSGKKCFYLSLDNLWFSENTLLALAEKLITNGVKHLFFDEIHRLPRWEQQLKNLYDSFPALQVVFAGSSAMEINNSVGDLSRPFLCMYCRDCHSENFSCSSPRMCRKEYLSQISCIHMKR